MTSHEHKILWFCYYPIYLHRNTKADYFQLRYSLHKFESPTNILTSLKKTRPLFLVTATCWNQWNFEVAASRIQAICPAHWIPEQSWDSISLSLGKMSISFTNHIWQQRESSTLSATADIYVKDHTVPRTSTWSNFSMWHFQWCKNHPTQYHIGWWRWFLVHLQDHCCL